MKRVGLLFGSFNPVHIGHLAIANYFYSFTSIDEIWFCVTPLNPWKKQDGMLSQSQRVDMLRLATYSCKYIRVTDFEKNLETPNYTYTSLLYLAKQYPQNQFILLIGGDNYEHFSNWKYADKIVKDFSVYAYSREDKHEDNGSGVELFKAPVMDISSTFIRKGLTEGKDMQYFLPNGVFKYLEENNLIQEFDAKNT